MVTAPRRAAGFYDPRTYDWEVGDSADRVRRRRFYVQQTAAAGARVLELGCGTGDVSLAVADRGAAVVGLDISADMLAAARAKGVSRGASPWWVRADMEAFAFRTRFHAVIVPYHALFHVLCRDVLAALLRRIHDHLEPGGILLADVSTRIPGSRAGSCRTTVTATPDGAYQVTATENFDAASRRLSTQFDYRLELPEGGTDTWTRELEYLITEQEELVELSRQAGFSTVMAFAAFDADSAIVPGQDAVLRAERHG